MEDNQAQAASQPQPNSATTAQLVKVDVSGVENIITLGVRRGSAMRERHSFSGVNQRVTVSLLPGTRVSICLSGVGNQVLVSKELAVSASESSGVENRLRFFSDDKNAA